MFCCFDEEQAETKHDITVFHCIIHQEEVCTKSFPKDFKEVINRVAG